MNKKKIKRIHKFLYSKIALIGFLTFLNLLLLLNNTLQLGLIQYIAGVPYPVNSYTLNKSLQPLQAKCDSLTIKIDYLIEMNK